jgi:CRP-like cAMP-binding protein
MKEVPMLRTLPDQEQRAMQKNLQMQEFADGDYIVRQGEYGDKFYIITEGSAMVLETIAHADGTLQDVVLTQLYEGHFFGEMALIYEEPRVASVCAVGRTTCMYLTKEAFRSALTAQQFQIMMQEISYKRVTTREMRLRTRTASEQPHVSPSISQAKGVARQSIPRPDEGMHQQDDQTERAQLAVQMTNILVRTRLNTGDRLINKYLIMEELGRGSYGGVYLCRNEETGQLYAMKMLTRSARHGKQLTETIRQEIAVMKKLRHPNIVTLHEVIDDPAANQVFLVQEYMEGGTVMNDAFGDPIPPSKARAYFRDMLQGVMYLHSVGVVHRDIKPQNMLLTADGVVKLADFGTAVFNR